MLMIAGFMFQWLPEATIAGMERRLTDPNLSSERKNELQGELLSWDIWKLTTFNPLSITLIVSGIIFILYSILDESFSLVSEYIEAKGSEAKG